MTLWRQLAILNFFLITSATAALAQTSPVALANGNFLNEFGLTAKISGLSCPSGGCAIGDELEVVPSGQDTITFEVINATANSAIFSTTSGSPSTMVFNLMITPSSSSQPTASKVSGATLTTTGFMNLTGSGGTPGASASAAFAATGATTPKLLDIMAVKGSTGTLQTVASGANSFTSDANAFTVGETLSLNTGSRTANNLAFTSVALKLNTVPEPASALVLLTGFTSTVIARRRRSAGSPTRA